MLEYALADACWIIPLGMIGGMAIIGVIATIAACMRSSQISRDEERFYAEWDARKSRD